MKKCKLAWSHLDFKPGGYAPCFRFKLYKGHKFGGVPDLPSEVINSDEWKRVRQQLRNDEWPAECVDCKMQEESGIKSYRQRFNDHPEEYHPTPDYSKDEIEVVDLQLKMSRACNYFCRHCGVSSNSAFIKVGRENPEIAQNLYDNHKFNHIGSPKTDGNWLNEIDIPTPEVIDDLFENILPTVRRIDFSGGEPFYHAEMYKFLQRMIDDPKIDTSKVALSYNTNMSMTKFKQYDIIDLWDHFRQIEITVSMDGTGKLFNYFRHGGDYDSVVENIHEMCNRINNLESLLLVCTTTAYHAFYINEISEDLYWLKQDLERLYNIDVRYRTTFVHWPEGLDIVNLAEDTKKKILQNLTYNDFTREFEMRLTHGKRTIPEETFKDIVKIQDQLYNKDASELAPKIFDYVY